MLDQTAGTLDELGLERHGQTSGAERQASGIELLLWPAIGPGDGGKAPAW
ncbi:MAG: hypothetical protein R3C14_32250 [Caldilineaceae bacterium]